MDQLDQLKTHENSLDAHSKAHEFAGVDASNLVLFQHGHIFFTLFQHLFDAKEKVQICLKIKNIFPQKMRKFLISRMTINPLESSFPRQDTRSKVLEPSCRRLATPQLRDSKLPASSAHLGCLEIRPRGWMRYRNISTYNKSLNLASKDEKHSDLHLPRAVMHAFFGGEMIQLSQSVVDC